MTGAVSTSAVSTSLQEEFQLSLNSCDDSIDKIVQNGIVG